MISIYLKQQQNTDELDITSEVSRKSVEKQKRLVAEILAKLEATVSESSSESATYLTLDEIGETGFPKGSPVYLEEIDVLYLEGDNLDVVRKSLQGFDDVESIEDGIWYHATEEQYEVESWETADYATSEVIPWGISRVRAPQAWTISTGAAVPIAIVDTGVSPHPDLPRARAGRTFVSGTNNYFDGNGHGTHVAGTALAGRNGIGVVGVAPDAHLIVSRVLGADGSGANAWVAAGIIWAANAGAKVINMSLGASRASADVGRACAYAHSRGALLVAAAGNRGCRCTDYPSGFSQVMSVTAIDSSNRKARFSQWGPQIDIAAPGVNILSTVLGSGYQGGWNGTSMAAPHVAGAAALVLATRSMTPSSLRNHLKRSAMRLGSAEHFGAGLLQADRAVSS